MFLYQLLLLLLLGITTNIKHLFTNSSLKSATISVIIIIIITIIIVSLRALYSGEFEEFCILYSCFYCYANSAQLLLPFCYRIPFLFLLVCLNMRILLSVRATTRTGYMISCHLIGLRKTKTLLIPQKD